jgi:hypothetical protein
MTDSARELGMALGKMAQSQSDLKAGAFGDEDEGLLNFVLNQKLVMTGTATLTAYLYATDSFILDHPVYGELDSAVLKLDGGYLQSSPIYAPSWNMTWDHSWGTPGGDVTSVLYSTSF